MLIGLLGANRCGVACYMLHVSKHVPNFVCERGVEILARASPFRGRESGGTSPTVASVIYGATAATLACNNARGGQPIRPGTSQLTVILKSNGPEWLPGLKFPASLTGSNTRSAQNVANRTKCSTTLYSHNEQEVLLGF